MTDVQFAALRSTPHVKDEVVKKVDAMLRKGRRHFGSAGANFTEQAWKPEFKDIEEINSSLAEKIVEAERDYSEFISEWIKDKPNAVLVDSLKTPGSKKPTPEQSQQDHGLSTHWATSHILFIGNEIFVIDSYPFSKKKRYSVDDDGKILQANKHFEFSDLATMATKFDDWIGFFDDSALLTSIVGFTGDDAFTERYNSWFSSPFRLLERKRYTEFLDAKYEVIDDSDKNLINPNLVAQAVIRANKPYDRYASIFDMKALSKFS